MKSVLFLLLFSLIGVLNAQDFNYQAKIVASKRSEYHKIVLSIDVYNKLNPRKSDIRILDEDYEEVPFLWGEEGDGTIDTAKFRLIPGVKFSQRDYKSSQRSTIKIDLPDASRIDRISFKVEGPVHFLRAAECTFEDLDNLKRNRRKRKKESIDLLFSSDSSLTFDISEIKTSELSVEIQNEDNPPLKVTDIKLYQKEHYLVAYLEKGKDYQILFGKRKSRAPRYELDYFESKLPKTLATTTVSKPYKRVGETEVEEPYYKKKSFIWSALILVIAILGFVSFRMVKELNKTKR